MLRVRQENHRLYGIGHAGWGPPGEDLVCAAASILTAALGENVKLLAQKGIVTRPVADLSPGLAEIGCIPVPGRENRVKALYDSFLVGFRLLEESWPDYVKVEAERSAQ